jgi:hypothetical protein
MVERLANVANWAEPCSQAAETYFMRDIRSVEEPPHEVMQASEVRVYLVQKLHVQLLR